MVRTGSFALRDGDAVTSQISGILESMIFNVLIHRNREMSVGLIELAVFLQYIFAIGYPIRVNQAKYAAAGNLRFVLVVFLHEAFRIQKSDIVHMVQPSEIFFFFWTQVMELASYVFGSI